MSYRGRFAPTPSGPLHFGSIITALSSYLQAKKNQGKWLVRIDDIDQNRTVDGADEIILEQLEKLRLFWDEKVVYQSHRHELYENAIKNLQAQDLVFPCACSRKELSQQIYPGTCRTGVKMNKTENSLRIRVDDCKINFGDLLQGFYSQQLDKEVGDFIIKRADGFFAYHLATVVDDAEQNITDIVRGSDLIDSTSRQVFLQKKLNYPSPSYLHLPVALDNENKKISKSINPAHIDILKPTKIIFDALVFLGQNPPDELVKCDIKTALNWSIENWNTKLLPKQQRIMVN